jgi:non-heme chloroperoxidase
MERRQILRSMALLAGAECLAGQVTAAGATAPATARDGALPTDSYIETPDGARLFYRDCGIGRPVVFVAPWALNSDWWEYQTASLSGRGLRCISYDRRGHGRSGQPRTGYDFETLAGDLGTLIEQLQLHDVVLVGHSMGCAEVVRYLSRQTRGPVARAVLIATITPFTLKTPDNPDGVDGRTLEAGRAQLARDRPHQVAAGAPAFFGVPKNAVSSEIMEWWTRMILDHCSLKVMLDLHRAFTETDFRRDLRAISVPTLLIHGDSDTSTPLDFTARRSAALIPRGELKVYEGAAHGLPITHMDRLNADLLAFSQA